jgi:hypothetical protein
VYSLIGLNFGGFLVGLLLGIIGGALTIAWSPTAAPTAGAPLADQTEPTEPALTEPVDYPPAPVREQNTQPQPRYDHGQPYENAPGYGDTNAPGYGDTVEIPRQAQDPDRWWGPAQTGSRHREEEPPPYGSSSGGNHTRMLAITLVPVTLAAVLFTVLRHPEPAAAAPCPTPSASTSATPKPSASRSRQATAGRNGALSGSAQPAPSASATASPSTSPSSATSKDGGNPLVDAWNGLVDGVKKLFGGGDSATPAATPSQSPSPSASASASGALPGLPGLPGLSALPVLPGGSVRPQAAKSASTAPCATTLAATAADQPPAAAVPGRLTGSTQNMENFTYEGVADLRTQTGTMKVLKFTMSKAVTKPFSLKVPEPISGKSTLIESTRLTTEGSVTFYTPKFTGTLTKLGLPLIPISIPLPPILTSTYTPESQPPLPPHVTFSSIEFTDVTIDLAFVRCDTLTGASLHISEV